MATTLQPSGPGDARSAPATSETPWERIAQLEEFKQLLAQKRKFVVPATIFFIVYYFALPISVGYFPGFMDRRVLGSVNIAYLFALSQFFVAWAIAWLYVRAAHRYDEYSRRVVQHLEKMNAAKGGQ